MENNTQKPVFIPRVVSMTEMINLINDKLDYLIAAIQNPEIKK